MKHPFTLLFFVVAAFGSGRLQGRAADPPPVSPRPDGSAAGPGLEKPSATGGKTPAGLGDYVTFPAAGIKLRQPEGFAKAGSFDGFEQPRTGASIMIVRMAGPFSGLTAGFTKEQMQARGWTLLSRQEVTVDGIPGLLVNFEQPARSTQFLKWSLAVGDEQQTTLITATLPKSLERELSARLKAALMSARRDAAADDPTAHLPFTVTGPPKLKLTPVISRMLTYTKDGVTPAKSPADPVLLIAPSMGHIAVLDKREFAERRIRQTARTKQLAVKSTNPVTIDGLPGYESLAEAVDAKSGTPLVVYQVMLFDQGAYFLMQGLVGAELREDYLPEFKAAARSFKRKGR